MSELNYLIFEGHQTLTSEMAFELFKLDREFFPTPWSLESWQKLFLEHDRLLMVLQVEGEIFGFCLFDKSSADSFAHLLKIIITPNQRGKGLSQKLLETSLLTLKKSGCSELFLEVEETNHAAINLYRRVGFQVIHSKKNFYGTNRSALIMTKS